MPGELEVKTPKTNVESLPPSTLNIRGRPETVGAKPLDGHDGFRSAIHASYSAVATSLGASRSPSI